MGKVFPFEMVQVIASELRVICISILLFKLIPEAPLYYIQIYVDNGLFTY